MPTPSLEPLSIFRYSDARSFLRDRYEAKKRSFPRWSTRAWARQLKLKSPSGLSMVLAGKRRPGLALCKKLSIYFKFNPDETAYFYFLVGLSRSKLDPNLLVLKEALRKTQPKREPHILSEEAFSRISNWYYFAIRQATRMGGFRPISHWLKDCAVFMLSHQQITIAVQQLLSFGLLKIKDEKIELAARELATTEDIASEAVKRFHEQMLQNASASIRKLSPTQREISGVTFPMMMSDLPLVKEMIRSFTREVCEKFEVEQADAVFHLELAFFPLFRDEEALDRRSRPMN